MKTTLKIFTLTAILFGFATISYAQESASVSDASVGANIITAISLAKDVPLHFGDIIAQTQGFDVLLTPANVRTTGGAALPTFTGSNPHTAGTFNVEGEANASYQITFPTSTTINGPSSATMTVKTFTSNKPNNKSTLNGDGEDDFSVGATLVVGNNQTPGSYSGTYTVTVTYE